MEIKTCTKCKLEKSTELFGRDKSNSDGLQYQCKECLNEYFRAYELNKKLENGWVPRKGAKEGYKICPSCQIEKPLTTEFFHKNPNLPSGLNYRCKECANKYERDLAKKKGRARNKWYPGDLTKFCRGCQKHLSMEEFRMTKRGPPYHLCRPCERKESVAKKNRNPEQYKAIAKRTLIKNREKTRARNKEKYELMKINEPEKYAKKMEKARLIREKRKAEGKIKKRTPEEQKRVNEQCKERKERDPLYKLSCTIRTRVGSALKRGKYKKNLHFKEYIGCFGDELIIYIESKFKEGMSWDNHGEWHVDHIIPLDLAKTEEDIYKLNHYMNLSPLWAKDNWSKHAKLTEEAKALAPLLGVSHLI